ncbi:MAG: branched-chain amino acid ABC transporter permease [Actinomycetales bacterium]|nr:MAG: branched-chain amino acid ABC transporter permease [Actinomycetales bacterium]
MRHGGVTKFSFQNLFGPIIIISALTFFVGRTSASLQLITQFTLCYFMMVLALQVFVGNSGVLSFGHGSFALIGSYISGMLTAPINIKGHALAMNQLWQALVPLHTNIYLALLISAIISAFFAALTGSLLMRLSGLSAGIATFALLGVTYNVFFNNKRIGPGSQALPAVPTISNTYILLLLAALAIVVVYLFNISSLGRTLIATREDAMAAPALGINIYRVRLIAFTLSGFLAGLSGGMYVHVAGTFQVQDYYLEFTFLTLSMLIIGGSASLWGALLGTIVISTIGQLLLMMEQDLPIFGIHAHIPEGSRAVIIAVAFVAVLLWRSSGIANGKEFSIPTFWRK